MDKIIIRDLLAHGIIGVYEHEREQTQDILINLILHTDTQQAAKSDHISDCLNYHTLAEKVKALAESSRRFTIEALTNDIATLCLAEKGVLKVQVRVEKPEAISFLRTVGVEIERQR
ncbi:MAG: dihydroneopterin aldolase [Chloroflexi bacterium]|nr:dihydroneopterin aldolase [Chloroflexota bacterium]